MKWQSISSSRESSLDPVEISDKLLEATKSMNCTTSWLETLFLPLQPSLDASNFCCGRIFLPQLEVQQLRMTTKTVKGLSKSKVSGPFKINGTHHISSSWSVFSVASLSKRENKPKQTESRPRGAAGPNIIPEKRRYLSYSSCFNRQISITHFHKTVTLCVPARGRLQPFDTTASRVCASNPNCSIVLTVANKIKHVCQQSHTLQALRWKSETLSNCSL